MPTSNELSAYKLQGKKQVQSKKFIRLGALHPSRGNEVMIVYANPIIPVIRRADQLFAVSHAVQCPSRG